MSGGAGPYSGRGHTDRSVADPRPGGTETPARPGSGATAPAADRAFLAGEGMTGGYGKGPTSSTTAPSP